MDIRILHAVKIHAVDLLFVGFGTIEFDYADIFLGFLWFQLFTAVRQYHNSELQRLQNNFLYYLCMIFHQLLRTCHHVQGSTTIDLCCDLPCIRC